VSYIILLERNYFLIKFNSYYFGSANSYNSKADLTGMSHSLFTNQKNNIETLHINLLDTEENLFRALQTTNRKQIKKASTRNLLIEINTNPTKNDLKVFQRFYNEFARKKKTYTCNAFHIDTMSRLAKQGALVVTKIKNSSEDILCYRVYITDGTTVMSLYSASHFRDSTVPAEKRLHSEASRYLLWNNILYFKRLNHHVYDMGGVTNNPSIRSYKMEFGGEITKVYSGYNASSIKGKFLLWLRKISMRKG